MIDSGQQAGVNCRKCRQGHRMYWSTRDHSDTLAVCRKCGGSERLFRTAPGGYMENRSDPKNPGAFDFTAPDVPGQLPTPGEVKAAQAAEPTAADD